LNRLVKEYSIDARTEDKTKEFRLEFLENVLPAPTRPLEPYDILTFKMKNGDKLKEFRFHVEKTIIDILKQPDDDLRQREIDLFKQKSQADIEEIKESMHEFGWVSIGLANMYSVAAEIPVIGIPLKITRAVHKAVTGSYSNVTKQVKNTPLLYAAVAQKNLLKC
jgi:hypothetical protein